jgi:hypothetical protein
MLVKMWSFLILGVGLTMAPIVGLFWLLESGIDLVAPWMSFLRAMGAVIFFGLGATSFFFSDKAASEAPDRSIAAISFVATASLFSFIGFVALFAITLLVSRKLEIDLSFLGQYRTTIASVPIGLLLAASACSGIQQRIRFKLPPKVYLPKDFEG